MQLLHWRICLSVGVRLAHLCISRVVGSVAAAGPQEMPVYLLVARLGPALLALQHSMWESSCFNPQAAVCTAAWQWSRPVARPSSRDVWPGTGIGKSTGS